MFILISKWPALNTDSRTVKIGEDEKIWKDYKNMAETRKVHFKAYLEYVSARRHRNYFLLQIGYEHEKPVILICKQPNIKAIWIFQIFNQPPFCWAKSTSIWLFFFSKVLCQDKSKLRKGQISDPNFTYIFAPYRLKHTKTLILCSYRFQDLFFFALF